MVHSEAKWIWYNGDFELYHSMKLHARRQEFGCDYPCFWALSAPYPNVRFCTEFQAEKEDRIHIVTPHTAYVLLDGQRFPVNADIPVPAGHHAIEVVMLATEGFPCLFVRSDCLVSDGRWVANHMAGAMLPVGDDPAYTEPTDDPRIFPFAYRRKDPVSVDRTVNRNEEQVMLYDFGRETFGSVCIGKREAPDRMTVVYGESAEEALDPSEALLTETVSGEDACELVPRAFRYISLPCTGTMPEVWVHEEYLPLTDRGNFTCDCPEVNEIYRMCAYTLHLNTREFFLDGIKRDRWCWSGDAYQSYMANNYLFFDPAVTRRTIIALLGKPPYEQHVNTINDYSMYLIIGACEYWFSTKDSRFLNIYYPRLKALYEFMVGRLDENGYMVARPGDWIFIDWSPMDKDGPLCAEQILLWQCHRAMADICDICGQDDGDMLRKRADRLKRRIMRDFWREDRGAFVDCATTGKENVTRHANIFAILYDFASAARKKTILRSVIENDSVTKLTTPYFEFFELKALCKMGHLREAEEKIESYWGGMKEAGATSVWERFDPDDRGAEHYGMYGMTYGCSLCHAWGGGPVYLFGRFALGVYPTAPGYETYAVKPDLGKYREIDGQVPLPDGGTVSVKADRQFVSVCTDRSGGTLLLNGQSVPIPVGKTLTLPWKPAVRRN